MAKTVIETERLLLREYTPDDFGALHAILSDPETMRHYPAPFDEERTRRWIEWNLDNYQKYGFGLWAMELKETGAFIGDCGLTLQQIDGETLPEIGYHVDKRYQRRGYAKEAARAVRDWAFQNTGYGALYSYMKYTNVGSYSTALAAGMKKVKEYPDPKNVVSYAYAITRDEWEWDRLFAAAEKVRNGRKISDCVEAGGVAAALLSASGRIYTGVCVDTCSSLGICAERNAIFNMITNGENEFSKVLAVMPDGKCGPPCGACRELMAQLMPEKYKGVKLMLDREAGRIVTLGELTPEWWI